MEIPHTCSATEIDIIVALALAYYLHHLYTWLATIHPHWWMNSSKVGVNNVTWGVSGNKWREGFCCGWGWQRKWRRKYMLATLVIWWLLSHANFRPWRSENVPHQILNTPGIRNFTQISTKSRLVGGPSCRVASEFLVVSFLALWFCNRRLRLPLTLSLSPHVGFFIGAELN